MGCSAGCRVDVDAASAPVFGRLAQQPGYRAAIVKMLAASNRDPPGREMLRQAAIDPTDGAATRALALTALSSATGMGSLDRAIDAFASLNVAGRYSRPSSIARGGSTSDCPRTRRRSTGSAS